MAVHNHRHAAAFVTALRANCGLVRRLELTTSWLGCRDRQHMRVLAEAASSWKLSGIHPCWMQARFACPQPCVGSQGLHHTRPLTRSPTADALCSLQLPAWDDNWAAALFRPEGALQRLTSLQLAGYSYVGALPPSGLAALLPQLVELYLYEGPSSASTDVYESWLARLPASLRRLELAVSSFKQHELDNLAAAAQLTALSLTPATIDRSQAFPDLRFAPLTLLTRLQQLRCLALPDWQACKSALLLSLTAPTDLECLVSGGSAARQAGGSQQEVVVMQCVCWGCWVGG